MEEEKCGRVTYLIFSTAIIFIHGVADDKTIKVLFKLNLSILI